MKVAVCVDDSSPSKRALEEASEFVEVTGGELVLVHSVQESVQSSRDELIQEGDGEAINKAEALLEEMKEDLKEINGDATVDTEILYSDNGKVEDVLSYLDEDKIDYVFIGHRALDKRKEELFGSFAKDMVSKSSIPVTVVSNN